MYRDTQCLDVSSSAAKHTVVWTVPSNGSFEISWHKYWQNWRAAFSCCGRAAIRTLLGTLTTHLLVESCTVII